ncbi:hypothetical protein MNB_SV-15-304 [hydrothermal vent metagenome]|uniref:Uncharacterized protein n=1 Tax=hydrothermal vent metagenome TaxID=652676 RepID=A0A1W1EIK3_9ZZZZ
MFNIALILLVSAEFCFYLLIAQTGIVEYFNSDLSIVLFLPIGAVVGSIASIFVDFKYKFHTVVFIQMILTVAYPNLSSLMLFIMGISLGAISVMVIELLKLSTKDDIMFALIISYGVGSLLFNSDIEGRWIIGFILSIIVFISAFFINFTPRVRESFDIKGVLNINYLPHSISIMFLWVFLDSTLFETLSRDDNISIWRDGFTIEIILFHIIGVVSAIKWKLRGYKQEIIILISFSLSFIFYISNEPLLLSIIYPFVISFYNVIILQTLIKENSFIKLSFIMLLIGWGASGIGLLFALNHWIEFIAILLVIMGIYIFEESIKIKLRRGYELILGYKGSY